MGAGCAALERIGTSPASPGCSAIQTERGRVDDRSCLALAPYPAADGSHSGLGGTKVGLPELAKEGHAEGATNRHWYAGLQWCCLP
jgi:hypothetical protein